jgi:hypothetical protein
LTINDPPTVHRQKQSYIDVLLELMNVVAATTRRRIHGDIFWKWRVRLEPLA